MAVARNGELTETLRTLVSKETKAELIQYADERNRSVAAVVRAAIRSYLAKGKR